MISERKNLIALGLPCAVRASLAEISRTTRGFSLGERVNVKFTASHCS